MLERRDWKSSSGSRSWFCGSGALLCAKARSSAGAQASRHHLAGVDMHVHDGHLLALFVVAVGGDHHFAKVLFVLDPVQFNLEAGKLGLLNVAFLQQRVDRSNDVLGAGSGRFALEVIEFDDHVSCESV